MVDSNLKIQIDEEGGARNEANEPGVSGHVAQEGSQGVRILSIDDYSKVSKELSVRIERMHKKGKVVGHDLRKKKKKRDQDQKGSRSLKRIKSIKGKKRMKMNFPPASNAEEEERETIQVSDTDDDEAFQDTMETQGEDSDDAHSCTSRRSNKSIATGACKRTKRGDIISSSTAAMKKWASERDIHIDGEDINIDGKKRPGRPITTGKGVLIREISDAKTRLRELHKEIENLEMVRKANYNEEDYLPPKVREKKQEMKEEFSERFTCELATEGLEIARRIDQSAYKSKNLQGGMKGVITDGSHRVEVIIDTIANRVLNSGNNQSDELERMREVIAGLQKKVEENSRLQKRVEELEREKREREAMPPPPLPPPRSAPFSLEMEMEHKLPQNEDFLDAEGEELLTPCERHKRNMIKTGEVLPPVNRPYLKAAGGRTPLLKEGEYKNEASPRLSRKAPQLKERNR